MLCRETWRGEIMMQKSITGTDGVTRTETEHIRWLVEQEVAKQLKEIRDRESKAFDEELTKRENNIKKRV